MANRLERKQVEAAIELARIRAVKHDEDGKLLHILANLLEQMLTLFDRSVKQAREEGQRERELSAVLGLPAATRADELNEFLDTGELEILDERPIRGSGAASK